MGACPIGDVSEDLGPVLELNPVNAVGKRLHHDPLHDRGALGHERQLYRKLPNRGHSLVGPWPLEPGGAVRINGPLSVIATVCSKYAESAPSTVHMVQPSGFM